MIIVTKGKLANNDKAKAPFLSSSQKPNEWLVNGYIPDGVHFADPSDMQKEALLTLLGHWRSLVAEGKFIQMFQKVEPKYLKPAKEDKRGKGLKRKRMEAKVRGTVVPDSPDGSKKADKPKGAKSAPKQVGKRTKKGRKSSKVVEEDDEEDEDDDEQVEDFEKLDRNSEEDVSSEEDPVELAQARERAKEQAKARRRFGTQLLIDSKPLDPHLGLLVDYVFSIGEVKFILRLGHLIIH